MLSLLGSVLGFGTSFLPSVMGFFEKKQANKQELLMLEAKAKYASELSKLKLKELDAEADIEEVKGLYNRAVIYDAKIYHGANLHPINTERLTQVFFFYSIDKEWFPIISIRKFEE